MLLLKRELKTLLFIILATGICLIFLTQQSYKIDSRVFSALPDFLTPTPTIIPPKPIQTTSMDSPDGTKILIMESQERADAISYYLFTSNKIESTRQFIFSKVENFSHSLSIPYNTWSPDNTYIFLKESTPTINNYYVFSSSGNSFSDGSQFSNIQALFNQHTSDYTILDVTGWAAPNLLIVNTKANKTDTKVSFWFDVVSQSFIQLGTYFN